MSIKSVMLSNHLILYCALLILPSIFPSISVFSSESPLHIKWQKYSSLCSSNNLSSEYWGLVSFMINWFDLLAIQSPPPQVENINSLALSLLYGPTVTSVHDYGKSNSIDSRDLSRQVMSLFFNILSRFVIDFLPRSKHLLISWLQSMSTVVLETRKIKSVTASTFPLPFAMKWWDQMPWS